MSVLTLWALVSLVGCCIGNVIVHQPGYYYDYNTQQYVYQWQPMEYQPYYYSPGFYQEPPRADLHPRLSFDEAQRLLQLYRVIRMVALFRVPPLRRPTSLDRLGMELTNDDLQQQFVELLRNVDGFAAIEQFDRDATESFVNDDAQLLLAIQRTLNALNLDADDADCDPRKYPNYYPYYYWHRCSAIPKAVRDRLRQLRDEANSLTVEQIMHEANQGAKIQAKEAEMTSFLENLTEDAESRSLIDDFVKNYDLEAKAKESADSLNLNATMSIDGDENDQKSRDLEFSEEELNELAAAFQLYLEAQKLNAGEATPEQTTPVPLATTVAPANSWLGSLIQQGNSLLSGHPTTDASPPMQKMEDDAELDELNARELDIDPRLDIPSSTEALISATEVTVAPLWKEESEINKETNSSKPEDLREEVLESRQDLEDSPETADEEARVLPDDEEQLQLIDADFDETAGLDADLDGPNEDVPETTAADDQTGVEN